MDKNSCVTALAITASSGGAENLLSIAAAVDQFVAATKGDAPRKCEALRDLRSAFDTLRLDGQSASAIETLIDDRISGLMSKQAMLGLDVGDRSLRDAAP